MSSIAWSTVVVVLLLTPGLLTLVGMYLPLRVSRDVVPQTGLSQLAYLASASALLHAPALLLVRLLSSRRIISPPDLEQILALSRSRSALDVGGVLYQNLGLILVYFLLLAVVGLAAGYTIGRLILRGPLRSLARHGWVYQLQTTRGGITCVSILTNVQEGTRALMYEGLLDHIYMQPDGAISYLTILNCARFYLMLENDAPLTTAADLHRAVSASPANTRASQRTQEFLFIGGEQIRDVVFMSYGYGRSATGRRLLESRLESLTKR